MTDKITFDAPMLRRLKRAYEIAVGLNQDRFHFEGHEYFVPYAKYLIEYLEEHLHERP